MIEAQIEKRIVEKLRDLDLKDIAIFGIWNDANCLSGMKEGKDKKGYVVVKVPTRGFDTYGICEVQYNIAISMVFRLEMIEEGFQIQDYTDKILGVLSQWNLVHTYDELSDFVVDGFEPGGINIGQGVGPDIDRNTKTLSMVFNLILRGTVNHEC